MTATETPETITRDELAEALAGYLIPGEQFGGQFKIHDPAALARDIFAARRRDATLVAVTDGTQDRHVRGHCPMGCGETLFLASGGYVTCGHLECPAADAVASVLADGETGHLVEFGKTTFTMWHPLRERLNGAMWKCPLHEGIARLSGPPVELGRYRVTGEPGSPRWEPLP